MAAKLLMKRFAIKDVSESLASFVIKYLSIVPLLRRWLLILSTCSLKIFFSGSIMDEKLWWGQWRKTKLQGIQAGKSWLKSEKLFPYLQSRPFSPQHQSQKLNQKVKTRRKKMQVKQLIDCLKLLNIFLIHIYLSFVVCQSLQCKNKSQKF